MPVLHNYGGEYLLNVSSVPTLCLITGNTVGKIARETGNMVVVFSSYVP